MPDTDSPLYAAIRKAWKCVEDYTIFTPAEESAIELFLGGSIADGPGRIDCDGCGTALTQGDDGDDYLVLGPDGGIFCLTCATSGRSSHA